MSFSPLPAPDTVASSSIWARRMITKSNPTTNAEVELNVLSLLLDVPEEPLPSPLSPVSPFSASSPWSANPPPAFHRAHTVAAEASFLTYTPQAVQQRSRSMGGGGLEESLLEMHAAQTAVKAALDVLEEPSLGGRGLRISTGGGGALGLTAPVSPEGSCFSESEGGGVKKKGRARMSQEKRKRLARRREREALVAALGQDSQQLGAGAELNHHQVQFSRSAPVTLMRSYFPSSGGGNSGAFGGFPFSTSPSSYHVPSYETAFNTPLSSPRSVGVAELPSPALTHASVTSGFGSIGTPSSSPTTTVMTSDPQSSPPTLIVQPPSPQRVRNGYAKQTRWNGVVTAQSLASVY